MPVQFLEKSKEARPNSKFVTILPDSLPHAKAFDVAHSGAGSLRREKMYMRVLPPQLVHFEQQLQAKEDNKEDEQNIFEQQQTKKTIKQSCFSLCAFCVIICWSFNKLETTKVLLSMKRGIMDSHNCVPFV